jgi:hypothetical protein
VLSTYEQRLCLAARDAVGVVLGRGERGCWSHTPLGGVFGLTPIDVCDLVTPRRLCDLKFGSKTPPEYLFGQLACGAQVNSPLAERRACDALFGCMLCVIMCAEVMVWTCMRAHVCGCGAWCGGGLSAGLFWFTILVSKGCLTDCLLWHVVQQQGGCKSFHSWGTGVAV